MKYALMASVSAAILAAGAAHADESDMKLTFSAGFDFSTGDYGAPVDTEIFYVPFTATFEASGLRLSAMVPYLRVDGPGLALGGPGGGGVIVDPNAPDKTSEDGIGDIIVSASYLLNQNSQGRMPFFEVTGRVKIPTADETRGLGTGKTDFTLQGDVFQRFGSVTPFLSVGYRWRGNSDVVALNDSWLASAGLVVAVNEQVSIGASYDYQEASTSFTDDVQEFSPFVVFRPSPAWSVNVYGVIGFSDASPDVGAGLQIGRSF